VEKIARALASAGYLVHAIGWDRSGQLPTHEIRDGYEISRLRIVAGYGRGMGNLPQLLRWQWGLMWWLFRHHREFDCIHACDFDTILPALWIRTLYHKLIVYDIFDFYADHLRKTPNWIKSLIRRTDIHAVNTADAVIIVDESRKTQLTPGQPKQLEIIYNSPEDCAITPSGNLLLHQDTYQLKIAYIGLLQIERGLFEIIHVLRKHQEWSLELAGFGGDEEQILFEISSMKNIIWHGRISYDSTLQLSQTSDVIFATYDPAIPNHRYSSPNKVFEAMMLAKPVIVAQDTNVDHIIKQYSCGLVVKYGVESELEAALTTLAESPDLRTRLGINGRKAYDQVYGWPRMRERLILLYQRLFQED
jgi:glycosyltransferase involved in cell wall biosynthesis